MHERMRLVDVPEMVEIWKLDSVLSGHGMAGYIEFDKAKTHFALFVFFVPLKAAVIPAVAH